MKLTIDLNDEFTDSDYNTSVPDALRSLAAELRAAHAALLAAADERDRLRKENERLQAAHDYQYGVAGTMLLEAERVGRENARLVELLREVLDDTAEGSMPMSLSMHRRLESILNPKAKEAVE